MRKERKLISVSQLELNTGQLEWLPKNPRSWTQTDIDRTAASIREDEDFLEDRPLLVVGNHAGGFIVFAGNLRREGAIAAGIKSVPCVLYISDTQEDHETIKRRAMKDNGSFGSWDYDILANEWDDLPLVEWGCSVWGNQETQEDNKIEQNNTQEDNFDEEKDQIGVICKRGDVWQLGDHRLMCGDSIDLQEVKKLMGGGG